MDPGLCPPRSLTVQQTFRLCEWQQGATEEWGEVSVQLMRWSLEELGSGLRWPLIPGPVWKRPNSSIWPWLPGDPPGPQAEAGGVKNVHLPSGYRDSIP